MSRRITLTQQQLKKNLTSCDMQHSIIYNEPKSPLTPWIKRRPSKYIKTERKVSAHESQISHQFLRKIGDRKRHRRHYTQNFVTQLNQVQQSINVVENSYKANTKQFPFLLFPLKQCKTIKSQRCYHYSVKAKNSVDKGKNIYKYQAVVPKSFEPPTESSKNHNNNNNINRSHNERSPSICFTVKRNHKKKQKLNKNNGKNQDLNVDKKTHISMKQLYELIGLKNQNSQTKQLKRIKNPQRTTFFSNRKVQKYMNKTKNFQMNQMNQKNWLVPRRGCQHWNENKFSTVACKTVYI